MIRVQALTEFTYDQIDRKKDDVIDMPEAHAFALQTLGKVVKAEDEEARTTTLNRRNTYKTRRLQAGE